MSDEDEELVKAMIAQGDLVDRSRDIDHYLYPAGTGTPQRAAVLRLIGDLEGWRARDAATDDGVIATVHAPATLEQIRAQVARMEAYAEITGFVYDGWEAPVVRGD